MPVKSAGGSRTHILGVAQHVLRRRGSARIIAIASARGDVRTLLSEYRGFMAESERLLQRDGIRPVGTVVELLRDEWGDALVEHQQPTNRALFAPLL
jgi:hypothetical protein